ncbi:MAG TPA: hypothetical protein VGH28_23965 [Polyangiaceae bacterium]|jgi:hypothetical protein
MGARLRVDLPLEKSSSDWRRGSEVLAPSVAQVEAVCRQVAEMAGATVRLGRCLSTQTQTEVGVYVERGARVGVFVGLRWVPGGSVAALTVGPGSRMHARLQWGALVMGLAVAAVVGFAFGPYAQPVIALAAVLLGGVGLGVVAMRVVVTRGLGLDSKASRKLAERVVERLTAP